MVYFCKTKVKVEHFIEDPPTTQITKQASKVSTRSCPFHQLDLNLRITHLMLLFSFPLSFKMDSTFQILEKCIKDHSMSMSNLFITGRVFKVINYAFETGHQ